MKKQKLKWNMKELSSLKIIVLAAVVAAVLGMMIGCGSKEDKDSDSIPNLIQSKSCTGAVTQICEFKYTTGANPVYNIAVPKQMATKYNFAYCLKSEAQSCDLADIIVTCTGGTSCQVKDLIFGNNYPAIVDTMDNQKVIKFQTGGSISAASIQSGDFVKAQAEGGTWVTGSPSNPTN